MGNPSKTGNPIIFLIFGIRSTILQWDMYYACKATYKWLPIDFLLYLRQVPKKKGLPELEPHNFWKID